MVEPSPGIKPYAPLALEGRDIYVREGCYNCHSQMVRPLPAETESYGHYSLAGEVVYDHPFQFDSKRTGPDLARVGGRYTDEWVCDRIRRCALLESAATNRASRDERLRRDTQPDGRVALGWLPCGLVYSMLVFAALSGEWLRGAGIMVAFGLGTMPAMVTSSAFAGRLGQWTRQRGTRQLGGVLLLLFGCWIAWSAISSVHHHHDAVPTAGDSRTHGFWTRSAIDFP